MPLFCSASLVPVSIGTSYCHFYQKELSVVKHFIKVNGLSVVILVILLGIEGLIVIMRDILCIG